MAFVPAVRPPRRGSAVSGGGFRGDEGVPCGVASIVITYTDGRTFRLEGVTNADAQASRAAFEGPGSALDVSYRDGGQNRVAHIPKALIRSFETELD